MRIDPAIERLRRDPAPQLRAQQALERARDDWRGSPAVAGVLREFDRYGEGAALVDCPSLTNAVGDLAAGRGFIADLMRATVRGLREHPLGHVPLRHQYAPGLTVMQLAVSGRATLALVSYEARPDTEPAQTVCFAGGERRELCLVGAAEARFFEVLSEEPRRADLAWDDRRLVAGDALILEGAHHTKIVDRPRERLVVLRLARTEPIPSPAREYRIADGALVHCAGGDRRESRDEMAAAVLGAMGRIDAAPVLAGIARAGGSDHFRWQALRQALALDSAAGFAGLTEIASDSLDSLSVPAGALRASLVERYPALVRKDAACPAS